jgi:uncharacterized protein YqiB (DUF1249 family)
VILKIESSIRPIKKYYIPSDMARCYSDPAFLKATSAKEARQHRQTYQLEPTVKEDTLKKVDPDSKL